MGEHIGDRLHSICPVMNSDEDQPVVMDIYAGFTSRGQLAVSVDYFNYEDPRYNCSTAAVVNSDDARRMARRHRMKFDDLPLLIAESMEEWSEIINPRLRDVRSCFKEITECLLDEGCRFRIERTYGKNDYLCC